MTRILVTGAEGSLGSALVERLEQDVSNEVLATDKDSMDVCSLVEVRQCFADWDPDLVYHLAGAKSAPDGEEHPELALMINGVGTWLVSEAAKQSGAKLVTASTCKAADPETAYGASKLLAEKLTLQAGGVVCRFYNVRETCGNVFRIWEELPEDEPLPVTACSRYFISTAQAIELLLWASEAPSGRYATDPGPPLLMPIVAFQEYPGREVRQIPPRRGDRIYEPLHGRTEHAEVEDGFIRITSPHDPIQVAACD